MKLSDKTCLPCEGGIPPLGVSAVKRYMAHLQKGWQAVGNNKLKRIFKFKNFVESMSFTNAVALLAQADNHHPDMFISYSQVTIELWTHAIGGLSENDFILAAKIDQLR